MSTDKLHASPDAPTANPLAGAQSSRTPATNASTMASGGATSVPSTNVDSTMSSTNKAPPAQSPETLTQGQNGVIMSALRDHLSETTALLGRPSVSLSYIAKFGVWVWLEVVCLTGVVSGRAKLIASKVLEWTLSRKTQLMKKLRRWGQDYEWMLQFAAGLPIDTFDVADIKASTGNVAVTSAEVLCSYTWKDTDTPTIYVPGFARKWNPTRLPPPIEVKVGPEVANAEEDGSTAGVENHDEDDAEVKLVKSEPVEVKPDTGMHWTDQNVFRNRLQQFEPVFRSISYMNPSFRFDGIHVVIGRSNLVQMYDLISGKSKQPFCLELKLVKNTLFMCTKGKGRAGTSIDSFGRNFEKVFTDATGEEDADGYHRVVMLEFGSLKLAVRFEVDAYDAQGPDEVVDDLFQGYKTDVEFEPVDDVEYPGVTTVIPKGAYIPQSRMVELKTTKDSASQPIRAHMAQYYFGRTNRIVVGERKSYERKAPSGEIENYTAFHTVTMHNLKDPVSNKKNISKMAEWEGKKKKTDFKVLHALLERVIDVTKKTEHKKAILRKIEKAEPFEIYEATEAMSEALPQALIEKFWN